MTSANQPPRPISPPQAAPRPTPSVRQPLFTPMQPARAPIYANGRHSINLAGLVGLILAFVCIICVQMPSFMLVLWLTSVVLSIGGLSHESRLYGALGVIVCAIDIINLILAVTLLGASDPTGSVWSTLPFGS